MSQDYAALVAAYRSGLTCREIGAMLGITGGRVHQILVKVGEPARPPHRRADAAKKEAREVAKETARRNREERARRAAPVLKLWADGSTCPEIAAELDLDLGYVRHVVELRGTRKHRKPPKAAQAILSIDKAFKAARLREAGKTKQQIADACGVPWNSVSRLIAMAAEARVTTTPSQGIPEQ